MLIKQRLWTNEDYHRMAAAGMLTTGDRVELLEGQIIETGPEVSTTQCVARCLDRLLKTVAYVRMNLPIAHSPIPSQNSILPLCGLIPKNMPIAIPILVIFC
jgi:hypothetical protein